MRKIILVLTALMAFSANAGFNKFNQIIECDVISRETRVVVYEQKNVTVHAGGYNSNIEVHFPDGHVEHLINRSCTVVPIYDEGERK